jgi:hypothetical protein
MYTVRGLVKNGAILLDEPVTAREGEAVLVTFMATAGHRALPGLEDVVAEIIALGPNPQSYIPPTASLAGLLANASSEEPIYAAVWDRRTSSWGRKPRPRHSAGDVARR